MIEFQYTERIGGAQEAIKRSRLVFLILTIASLAILVTAWNAYFSWYRQFPLDHTKWAKDEVTAFAQQHLVEGWVKSRIIDISLLGIHIGISDAAPLAGLTVFILSIWFFFSTRRENHTIGLLLRDSKSESDAIRSRIFHGVASYLVFLTIAPTDDPIRHLQGGETGPKPAVALRLTVRILFFLAPLANLIIIVCDVLTIFSFRTPFRESHEPLWKAGQISGQNWFLWGGLEVASLLLATWSTFLCWRVLQFELATGAILKEYAALSTAGPDKNSATAESIHS